MIVGRKKVLTLRRVYPGSDPGFVERGGGAQRLPRAPQARMFLKGPVFQRPSGISKGGARAPPPPESASGTQWKF